MGMLGNSSRGLLPLQKRLLYQSYLVAWRCRKPLLSTQYDDELQGHLSKIDFGDREQVFRLTNGAKTADLELGEDEVLLVQVLGVISKFIFLLLFSSVFSRPVL